MSTHGHVDASGCEDFVADWAIAVILTRGYADPSVDRDLIATASRSTLPLRKATSLYIQRARHGEPKVDDIAGGVGLSARVF